MRLVKGNAHTPFWLCALHNSTSCSRVSFSAVALNVPYPTVPENAAAPDTIQALGHPIAASGHAARAADELGYFGMLLPTGKSCEDSWVVASSMIPLTQRVRFLVAVRPGLSEPSMTARMAAPGKPARC